MPPSIDRRALLKKAATAAAGAAAALSAVEAGAQAKAGLKKPVLVRPAPKKPAVKKPGLPKKKRRRGKILGNYTPIGISVPNGITADQPFPVSIVVEGALGASLALSFEFSEDVVLGTTASGGKWVFTTNPTNPSMDLVWDGEYGTYEFTAKATLPANLAFEVACKRVGDSAPAVSSGLLGVALPEA